MPHDSVIQENIKRRAELYSDYNPLYGIGSPISRVLLSFMVMGSLIEFHMPLSMKDNPLVRLIDDKKSIEEVLKFGGIEPTGANITDLISKLTDIRFDNDFEFWAFNCAKIQDKESKRMIQFRLNKPQRKLLGRMEKMRLAGTPIRIILLKARQWGGSTLVQIYMGWIQNRLEMAWHSAVITDVEDQARNIRNMYTKMAKHYPAIAGTITLKAFAGSTKSKVIAERECTINLGSAQKPESLRSFDFAMLHLSEVGLWKDTPMRKADDLAQSLQSTIPEMANTLIVLESTAKGVGNFFHRQWLAAESKKSIFDPVFVAWWEIERYQRDLNMDVETFISSWSTYEWFLWDLGATIEGIYWYRYTKDGYGYDDWRMMSEYPSTAREAFQSSGRRAFAAQYVQNAYKTCEDPVYIGDVYGDSISDERSLMNLEFKEDPMGRLLVWSLPDKKDIIDDRYAVFADIGGRSEGADYCVAKVFDRYWMMDGGVPEVVAVWHGHIDQDIFAWKCAQIAQFFNNAKLAIETNSLKKEKAEGDHFLTVLDKIAPFYENLFIRKNVDNVRYQAPVKYGFHTNKATKPMIIDTLNAALRDKGYVEKDQRACVEMDYYEIKPDGSYGAVDGQHDDHVIVSAGGVWLCYDMPKPTMRDSFASAPKKNKIVSEASI